MPLSPRMVSVGMMTFHYDDKHTKQLSGVLVPRISDIDKIIGNASGMTTSRFVRYVDRDSSVQFHKTKISGN